jgi:hypothetical protein
MSAAGRNWWPRHDTDAAWENLDTGVSGARHPFSRRLRAGIQGYGLVGAGPMKDDTRAAAQLLGLAIVWAIAGLLLTGTPLGLLVGAPVALAAIFRAFGHRDPSDWF